MLAQRESRQAKDVVLVEIERRLLGLWLADKPGTRPTIAMAASVAEYFNAPHDRIFRSIASADMRGFETGPAAIALEMEGDPGLTEAGGREYLAFLAQSAPAVIDAAHGKAQIERGLEMYRNIRVKTRLLADLDNVREGLERGETDVFEGIKNLGNVAEEIFAARVAATPFIWIPPEEIPTRRFLFSSRHAIAGFASATGAIGGTGKSALIATEALAHCTGRNLLNDTPLFRGKAWILGLEDAREEHQRRVTAAALLHKIDPADFEGRLYLDDASQGFVVARHHGRDGLIVSEPLIVGIIERIRSLGITLLYVDPFVACHGVPENDNGAIDCVARIWVRIANETGCAVDLSHHLRKGNGNEPSADDFRGASALVPAVRSARLLATMDEAEAVKLGVTERFRYFRVIDGKKNMSARNPEMPWREIMPIDLKNGPPSDIVAAVCPWRAPNPTDTASAEDLDAIKAKVSGGKWRESVQAKAWVGNVVAEVMGLDLQDPGARATVQRAVQQWIREGVLLVIEDKDERRKTCKFVVVG